MVLPTRNLTLLLAAGIASCASDLDRSAASLTPLPADAQPANLRIPEALTLIPNTGYSETVRAGSTWQRVGATPQGEVYRPVAGVFTVGGANRHEAYLVIAQGKIVGFYLPGERAFAPLPQAVLLPAR